MTNWQDVNVQLADARSSSSESVRPLVDPCIIVALVKLVHVVAGVYLYAISFFRFLMPEFSLRQMGVWLEPPLRLRHHNGKAKVCLDTTGMFAVGVNEAIWESSCCGPPALHGMSLVHLICRYRSDCGP